MELATTGNAGPTKGGSDAEIGTVCIAIATPEGVFSQQFNFGKQRLRVSSESSHNGVYIVSERNFSKNAKIKFAHF